MTPQAKAPGWFVRNIVHSASGWITFLTFAFMLLPIAVLIVFAFNEGKSTVVWTGFSFKWFEKVIHNRNILDALRVSLIVAVGSAAVSTAIGSVAAVAITRRSFPGRDLLGAALAAPLVLPEIVLGVALLVFMSFADMTLGYTTLIIGHVLVSIPFATLIVRAAASSLDPRLENAAADLGANEWQTFRMVTLPQLIPAIFTAFILAATLSFDNLVMSTFTSGVGTTTLPLRIYSMLKLGITPEINALGALMVLANVTILMLVMGRYLPLMLKTNRH